MRIIKTADCHAIMTDDDEVILPSDMTELKAIYGQNKAIIEALLVALAEDVTAIIPVAQSFVKAGDSPSSDNAIRRGVAACLGIHSVAMAVANYAEPE